MSNEEMICEIEKGSRTKYEIVKGKKYKKSFGLVESFLLFSSIFLFNLSYSVKNYKFFYIFISIITIFGLIYRSLMILVSKISLKNKVDRLMLDRIIKYPYPQNYGYIPQTLGEDGDCLDVICISDEKILPSTQVFVRVIGVINMKDSGENDPKIIALVHNEKKYLEVTDINDKFIEKEISEIISFFNKYKENKIIIGKIEEKLEAEKLIKLSRNNYYVDKHSM